MDIFQRTVFITIPKKNVTAVANESLVPYKLIKRAPERQNLQYCNTECRPKPNKKKMKCSLVFRARDFVPHKYKQ